MVRTDQVEPRDATAESYEAADITVLRGLEPVRLRPGMFIGSTSSSGLHHLVWEVVDNSVDEAMQGHCTRIDVTIRADGSCRVVDNGRGIPVDPHPDEPTKSAAEIVLTVLHAGGKFGGSSYKVSGGLHGVGVSVVNALSSRLELQIDRGGNRYEMAFIDGGKPTGPLRMTGPSPRNRTGTTVTFWPDASIFDEVEFRAQTILERLQMMAFLQRGLEIRFRDDRVGHEQAETYRFTGGIEDFVRHLNASKESLFRKVAYFAQVEDDQEIEVALQWNTSYYESIWSFANGIATVEGGMHEEGFKKALTNVVNRVRARARCAQGLRPEHSGRGHPGGPHGDHLGAVAQSPVRRPDEGEARQRDDPLARRAGDEREACRVARREPARGEPDPAEGSARPARPRRGAPGA